MNLFFDIMGAVFASNSAFVAVQTWRTHLAIQQKQRSDLSVGAPTIIHAHTSIIGLLNLLMRTRRIQASDKLAVDSWKRRTLPKSRTMNRRRELVRSGVVTKVQIYERPERGYVAEKARCGWL